MRDLPSGTLTLLFTDIEGSTRLLHALGDRYPEVLAAHRDLLRAALQAHGGVEVDTQGDAFFYVFPRATQAVAAAVETQRALATHPWPEQGTVRVRMGLHTGEPQRTAEGYAGLDVHRAARICAAGHGGQVLLSEATAVHVRQAMPDGVQLRNLGDHRLKDLVHPERLSQLDVWGLPVDFPPVRSLDTRPNNLPTPPTPLIGREQEVEQLVGLLRRDDVRFVTLTGPGGTGKTRLGLRVATEVLHDFRDGVFFVALAPITDPALVLPTIAQTLGVREAEGRPVEDTLREYLRERQLLLMLDNFEQVAASDREVAALLTACPRLKALITSRTVLHLSGEREYPVPPLPLPDLTRREPAAVLSQYAAVRLFVERAVAVRPDFAITSENAPAVAEICVRLDGLPLAIELAAARIKLLSPQALLGRLEHRLRVLTGGAHDLPAHQRTLRDTIAWSYDLLTPTEQALFRRLAVFVGGCTLEAAEAVCGQWDDPSTGSGAALAITVLDGLGSLVDKSLLVPVDGGGDEARLGMLATIREFALEQLEAHGEAPRLRRQHARFFTDLVTHARGAWRHDDAWFVAFLNVERDNIRAALAEAHATYGAWAVQLLDAVGLSMGKAEIVWPAWSTLAEGRQWVERTLALPDLAAPSPLRARSLGIAAALARGQADYAAAWSWATESVALWRDLGDDTAEARYELAISLGVRALAIQGLTLQGRSVDAAPATPRALAEEGVRLARRGGDLDSVAMALLQLGMVLRTEGDADAAQRAFEESVRLYERTGDRHWRAVALMHLTGFYRQAGRYAAARTMYQEALRVFHEVGDTWHIVGTVRWLGQLARREGDSARAARLLGAAEQLRERTGVPIQAPYRAGHDEDVAVVRAMLGDAAFAGMWAAGRALSLEEAIAEALAMTAEVALQGEVDER